MDGDAGLGFPCGYHSLVHMTPVHPLATIFWQKRRMDVDDFPGITPCKECRNHKQETGQHYGIDRIPFQHTQHLGRVVDFTTRHNLGCNTQVPAALQHPRLTVVAHHKHHFRPDFVLTEVPDYVLGIGAVA